MDTEPLGYDRPFTKIDWMKNSLLVTLADGNYVDQAKQLFSSVYRNAGWTGDYLLLAHDIPDEELSWFRDKGILVKECQPVLTDSDSYIGHAPLTTLCKFYLFTPDFRQWENIVFLDGDIIVRGSLEALSQINGFGAVRILNMFRTSLKGQFHKRSASNEQLLKELERNFDLRRPAFNAGVMAFNTDIISDTDFQKLTNLLFHFKDIIFISEETVLNMYFYDTWQELSQVFNICPGYEIHHSGCGPDNLKGVVSHTYSSFPGGKPWNLKSPLHPEWKSNLDKADCIDLANPRAPKIELNESEEAHRDSYLKNLHLRYFYRFYCYKISYFFKARVNALINYLS